MSTFIPAYKDTFYEYSGDSLSFYILMEGAVIYQGKAYKSPSETSIKINVNKIAKDYLEQHITDFRDSDKVIHRHPQAFHFFDLYRADGTLLETYGVLFDWEGTFDGSTKVLSDPIKRSISKEMKPLFSVFSLYGDTFFIDFEPAIRNTYFTLLTTSLSINNAGGNYTIQWDTDYYPFSDFIITAENGSVLGYGNRGPSGATVTFAEAPSPAPRTFNVNIYFKNTSTLLGTVQVLQSSVDFNLITKTVYSPASGGTYQIRWITEADPTFITVEAVGWPGTTVTGITERGCTVTVPENHFPSKYNFDINYYYEYEGDRYFLDSTNVEMSSYNGATSGDTGDTSYVEIESAVTRDLRFTADGAFAGFSTCGIMVWPWADITPFGYYPVSTPNQYKMSIFRAGQAYLYISNNISLCKKDKACPSRVDNRYVYEFEGCKLSGSTQWLNDYLSAASGTPCDYEAPYYETYTGNTHRIGYLYLYSGDTILDTNIVIQPPYGEWKTGPADITDSTSFVLSSITPYRFSDFKFKSTGYTESEVREILASSVLTHSRIDIYDGVKVSAKEFDLSQMYGNFLPEYYDPSAFVLTMDEDGWTTVTTPLPVTRISNLSGLPASEIWISRNVKRVEFYNGTSQITGATYEGTKQDFRNVLFETNYNRYLDRVHCSDGDSYGLGRFYGKSDAIIFSANEVRPAFCNEYFYATDDPTPSSQFTAVWTGSTALLPGGTLGRGRDGEPLTVLSYTTGLTDSGYAYTTYELSGDLYYFEGLTTYHRSVSDTVRYYGSLASNGSRNIAEPMTRMRVINNNLYNGNQNLPEEMEFKNLRAVLGDSNLSGTQVKVLKAPNLLYMAASAFTGSSIEELYVPSLQYVEVSFPTTLTKLTIGKNFCIENIYTFYSAQLLEDLYFNGSVEEWNELNDINSYRKYSSETKGLLMAAIENYSNINTIWCDNGEVHITR